MSAERLHVRQVRHPVADPVEVVHLERDARLAGDGEQVQYGIGGTAERHHDRDRVLERLPGGASPVPSCPCRSAPSRPRPTRAPYRRDCGPPPAGSPSRAAPCRAPPPRSPSCWRCTSRRTRPRRGRSPARSGRPRPREISPRGAGADGLERVGDGDLALPHSSGQDRPRVHEHRGHVQPRRGHQHAGQALVAAGEEDGTVEPFRLHHRLHRVGDDLSADQRLVHADVAHRDAVRHRDRAELHRVTRPRGARPPCSPSPSRSSDRLQGVISVPARRDADLGFAEVLVAHPDARSMPRAAVRSRPSVTSLLRGFRECVGLGWVGSVMTLLWGGGAGQLPAPPVRARAPSPRTAP